LDAKPRYKRLHAEGWATRPYTEIVYGPTGTKLVLMNGQSLTKAFVPLPAGATAIYNSSGLEYYRHADWLGSARLTSTPSRTVSGDVAYAPFGETYAESGSPNVSFTGQNPDTNANLYDFMYREYGIQGRWPSPDPLRSGAFNLAEPQSLNLYAYVRNTPTSYIDPLGLCGEPDLYGPGPNGSWILTSFPDCSGMGGAGVGGGDSNGCPSTFGAGRVHLIGAAMPADFRRLWEGAPCGPPGGGGSSRGPSPKAGQQPPQTQAHPYLTCVANSGNEASLQGLLQGVSGGKLGNGWLAGAFLGNPFSDAIQFFDGSGSGAAAAGDTASAVAPAALKAVPNVSVSYTSTTVTASPSEFTVITKEINAFLPLGDVATGAAEVLGGFSKLVQIPVDLTATGFGAVVCAAGPPGG
jgi:RHS repeat-associated protein